MSTAKGERLAHLHASRKALYEVGVGPRRLERMMGGKNVPRNATIHEFLSWTCTAREAQDETEYDFSGFRLVLLYPRERNIWPAPAGPSRSHPQPRADGRLGAPLDPWPGLAIKGRPLSAATIRAGPGYLEVPFVATHENKRGRGFGRCVVEAIEEIARALAIQRLLLCSTKEEHVHSTWRHLGFLETTEADLESLDVQDADLIHMQNTIQMQKPVPPPRRWRSIIIRHEAFSARTYAPLDGARGGGGGGGGAGGAGGAREESFAVGMTESANGGADGNGNGNGGGGGSFDQTAGSFEGGARGEEDDGGSRPHKRGPGALGGGPRPRRGSSADGGGGEGGGGEGRPAKQQRADGGGSGADGGGGGGSEPSGSGRGTPQAADGPGPLPQREQQQQQDGTHGAPPPQPRAALRPQPSEASSDVLVFGARLDGGAASMEVG
ncbi:hypothetical protein Rsub_04991 [Raphidocelis subcapitata]|uniref:N-acetyltransferase domain-containing protein n=1 Tax=Raphidocelis subcapitata TaxID=307507 RepID=A0A2V0NW85_9CHLO|nr:hypothetical protein Rsub_04991 [Raphidocelis subcapitata]|eukprot:GBF91886.1 hypothetical protein Rsub_04991 [Raphidocelis subcapitata]